MFRVEFVVVLPEVARCADTVGEMVVMNFLGQAEFTSDRFLILVYFVQTLDVPTRLACL